MRILIVDDLPDNLRVLSKMMIDDGHRISAVTSGAQALRLAETIMPDLILLDVMMPELDGYQTCAALKANPLLKPIPVIFITALTSVEDETRGLATGAVDYIVKPFNEAIVKQRVRTHLELKHQRDLLERLAQVDGLTGIPNRRALDQRLEQEWRRAARAGARLGLAMIDIDHFKPFNDAHGHLQGDDCLRRVAGVLDETLKRAGDFVARYGGEEFVCLVSVETSEGLGQIAEQLRMAVEALRIPHAASAALPWVTVSIGAVLCELAPQTAASAFLEQADVQLYLAKQAGRNQVCLACG
ncbi:diguanylate cyclase [uncultured Thiocystis sp.]|jgi:diguanylate cyclase (GGDEF)-like protein|uniref:GGDEF domain-containing protein n=1 Tax=uncultured Thiocystis sp. TaxID=1202134 RepID=UPI0025DFC63E|nr:diguanylate cyclase [uncultured Thiocystis sp.]